MGKMKLIFFGTPLGLLMALPVKADVELCTGMRHTSPIASFPQPQESVYCAVKTAVIREVRPFLGDKVRIRFVNQHFSAMPDGTPKFTQRIVVDVMRPDLAAVMRQKSERTLGSLENFARAFTDNLCRIPDFRQFVSGRAVAQFRTTFHLSQDADHSADFLNAPPIVIASCEALP